MEENLISPQIIQVPKAPVQSPKKNNLPAVVFFVVMGLVLVVGAVYAGIKIGRKQTSPSLIMQNTRPTPVSETNTPTSNETANWKIYRNSKYGFEFKYPKAWTEEGPVSKEDTTIVYIYADEKFGEMPDPLQYYVWVSEINKLPNLEYTKESIGGYAAYKTDKEPSRFGALDYFITKEGNKYIEISLTPYDSSKSYPAQDRYISIFDQILSTFKFLDQKETKYTCPQNGWVDCMPIMDEAKKLACSNEAENWYKTNCPDFKGFAQ